MAGTTPMPERSPIAGQQGFCTIEWIRWFTGVLATFGGLRSELDTEVATRAAADTAEAGTRGAADTALDARLDVLEALNIAARLTAAEAALTALDARLDAIEAVLVLPLPTSAGATGTLWNDAGTVKVSP